MKIQCDDRLVEVSDPHGVMIVIRDDGKALWITVDGEMICRIGNIGADNTLGPGDPAPIQIIDQRK